MQERSRSAASSTSIDQGLLQRLEAGPDAAGPGAAAGDLGVGGAFDSGPESIQRETKLLARSDREGVGVLLGLGEAPPGFFAAPEQLLDLPALAQGSGEDVEVTDGAQARDGVFNGDQGSVA